MSNSVKSPISQIERIVRKICGQFMSKPHLETLVDIVLAYIAAFEKKHFLTLDSYGKKSEKTYRRFFEKFFDIPWSKINIEMAKAIIGEDAIRGLTAIAIDASYIRKAGFCTPGVGMFFSGVAGCAKLGLELLGLGLICPAQHICVGLTAIQSPDKVSLEQFGKGTLTLMDWYIQIIRLHTEELKKLSQYIVGDAAFANTKFVLSMLELKLHVISRFRSDVSVYYALTEEEIAQQEGKRGRPRIYGDKINPKELDYKKLEEFTVESKPDCQFYTCLAYKPKWKRHIRLVIMREKTGNQYYFMSTDVNMSGEDIYLTYHNRFQLEYVFRDGKQFFGLMECQARSCNKISSSYNISIIAINVVRILCEQNGWAYAPFKVKKLTNTCLNFFKVLHEARIYLTPQKIKNVIVAMQNSMEFNIKPKLKPA